MLVHLRDVERSQPLVDELDDGPPFDGADAHHVGETLQVGVAQVLLGVLDVVQHQPALDKHTEQRRATDEQERVNISKYKYAGVLRPVNQCGYIRAKKG